jgi:N-acetylneuraminic acid mutarotase
VLVVAIVVGAGGGGSGSTTTAGAAAATSRRARNGHGHRSVPVAGIRVAYRPLYSLPAPLRDPATTTLDAGRFVMAGGLDAADVSTSEVDLAGLHGLLHSTTLPEAQHDAEAAALGGRVYIFGGGSLSELDHILAYDPATGRVTQVGTLPSPQSDSSVAQWGDTAYIVGGFDGTNWLSTIIAYKPGALPQVVGRLPVGLRYTAVAAADHAILVLGGTTPTGTSDAIYRFDLSTHAVTRLGSLRHPVTHAGAALLGNQVYLVGGRNSADTSQYNGVWAIDPVTGKVRAGGHLPQATSDAAVTAVSGRIIVAGGLTPSGSVLASVGELVPSAR